MRLARTYGTYGTGFFVKIIRSVWPSESVMVHAITLIPESMVHWNEGGISAPVAVMMPSGVTLKAPDIGIKDPSDSLSVPENKPFG